MIGQHFLETNCSPIAAVEKFSVVYMYSMYNKLKYLQFGLRVETENLSVWPWGEVGVCVCVCVFANPVWGSLATAPAPACMFQEELPKLFFSISI